MTAKPYRSHEDATVDSFARDPEYAAEYLSAVLADGDHAELLLTLRRFARAFGGVGAVAEHADLNSTSLYRALSKQGNPALATIMKVLDAMDLRLAVQPRNVTLRSDDRGAPSTVPHAPASNGGPFVVEHVRPRVAFDVSSRFFAKTAGASAVPQHEGAA